MDKWTCDTKIPVWRQNQKFLSPVFVSGFGEENTGILTYYIIILLRITKLQRNCAGVCASAPCATGRVLRLYAYMVRTGGVCLCFFCNFVSKAEKVNKIRGKCITKMETHGEIFVSGRGIFVAKPAGRAGREDKATQNKTF